MATLFDDASLVMIPSGYKDDKLYSIKPTSGDGDFTFSRDGSGASPATRVNASGLIEKGRTNLLLQSNSFDTTWIVNNATITSGEAGYDGTNDAWLLSKTGTAYGSAYQTGITATNGGVYSFSVYAKANTTNFASFRLSTGAGADNRIKFNLTNGAISLASANNGTRIDAVATEVGNGWYRCSITAQANSTTITVNLYAGDTADTSGSVYVQDAQVEKGLVATSYIETTTAAASAGILGDMPRLDYSGGATCPSLLLEPARTNLLTHSEYFADFSLAGGALTANDATSPEGVQNAYKFTEDSANSQHRLRKDFAVSAGDHTISVFVKGTSRYLSIYPQTAATAYAVFDLENGTVTKTGGGNYVSSSIESYANDWYRIILTCTASASTLKVHFYLSNSSTAEAPTYTGDGSSYLHFYGAQVEQGSYPTSYVPTYGSATARAGDSCSKTGISSLIGQTEGTLFIDFIRPANALIANQVIYGITDTGSQNRLRILTTGSDAVRVLFQTNGNQIEYDVNLSFTLTPDNTPIKLAVGYKSGDIACYVNGNQADTSSNSITITTSIENIEINSTPNSNVVSQALLFDTRLTNAELAALTTL